MKRLIAFTIVFTLLTFAAFAQVSLGGALQIGVGKAGDGSGLLYGSSTPGVDRTTGIGVGVFNYEEAKINFGFGDSDAGGKLVLFNSIKSHETPIFGFLWWKPIPQLRIQIGQNKDGDWGAAQISGWGFTSEGKNVAAFNDYNDKGVGIQRVRGGFYGGVDKSSVNFTIAGLVDGLTINVAFPVGGSAGSDSHGNYDSFLEYLLKFHINVIYAFDFGTLRASWVNGLGNLEADADRLWKPGVVGDPATAYLSFYLTELEGIRMDLGLAYKFPSQPNDNAIQYSPIQIGYGLTWGIEAFQIKFRAYLETGGSAEIRNTGSGKVTKTNDPTYVAFNLLPNYNLGKLTAFLYMGLGIAAPDGKDAVVDYFINPYIRFPVGGVSFWAGFKIWSDGVKNSAGEVTTGWALPLGFTAYF
jgi:hypothetical protein